jgi:hypothetical protein
MEKKRKNIKWSTAYLNELIQEIIDWHIDNEQAFGIVAFFVAHKDKYNYVRTNFYNRLEEWGDEESKRLMNELNVLMEQRMITHSLTQLWSSNMAKFLLNCKFGYVPKTQQTIDVKGDNVKFEFDGDDTPAE